MKRVSCYLRTSCFPPSLITYDKVKKEKDIFVVCRQLLHPAVIQINTRVKYLIYKNVVEGCGMG
jgi:hypothetical protein